MKYRILNFLLRLGRFVMSELPFILIFTFCLVPTTLKDMLLNPQRLSASKYLVLAFLFAVIFSLVARKFKGGGELLPTFWRYRCSPFIWCCGWCFIPVYLPLYCSL